MQGTNFIIGQDQRLIFLGLKPANERTVQQPRNHASPDDQVGNIQDMLIKQRASTQEVDEIHKLIFANEENFAALVSEDGLQVGDANISMEIAEGASVNYQEIKEHSTEWCLVKLPSDNPDQSKYQLISRATVAKMLDDGYNLSNLTPDMILQGKQVLDDVLEPLLHATFNQQDVVIPAMPNKFQVQAAVQAAAQVVQVASRVAAPVA